MNPLPRVLAVVLCALAVASAPATSAAVQPPERTAGKLAWAELLTSGAPADSAAFYSAVFGWRAEITGEGFDSRVTFLLGDRPIAAAAHRAASRSAPPRARWLLYFATADLAAATGRVSALQGRVLAQTASPDPASRAVLADPEGAIFGLLPAGADTPEEYAATPGEWIWPVLFARRPDTLVEFYRDVLGHDVHPEHRTPLFSGDFVLADGPRARAGAMALPAGTTGRPAWLGLIRVNDLDATVQAVIRHGGEVLRPPTEDLIGGRVAVVSDPAGAVFGLVQLAAATGPHASGPARVTRLRP